MSEYVELLLCLVYTMGFCIDLGVDPCFSVSRTIYSEAKIKTVQCGDHINDFDMEFLLQGPLEPIKSLSYNMKITQDFLGQTKEIIQMSNPGPDGPQKVILEEKGKSHGLRAWRRPTWRRPQC